MISDWDIVFQALQASLGRLDPLGIGLVIAILILSLGAHEAAHGWVALRCGDPTARDLGRITLNPLPHIDPFMTILLPAFLAYTTGFIFGGARPVPVNFYNLRKPYRDMALVAIAGPLSNFLIACLLFFLHVVVVNKLGLWEVGTRGADILLASVFFNLVLTAFNLIPIPPLDGSRVMTWLLPESLRPPYQRIEAFGIILILVLLYLVPPFQHFLWDTLRIFSGVTFEVATLGGLL